MFIGFDTSNYTTSVAAFDGSTVIQRKKLLEVRQGERGLRQSEAVFQHTVNLAKLINSLADELGSDFKLDAIGVSNKPRNVDGSYMPCFLVGENTAEACAFGRCGVYKTSHQVGHILSALFSCKKLNLTEKPFIAFHLSGGTTEALLVTPDCDELIKAEIIAQSLDLKAGQAIDRAGVMLGLKFPCGAELDRLSKLSNKRFNIKPSFNGLDCSLSGIENKAHKMLESGECDADIAAFVIQSICVAVDEMLERIIGVYGNMPIVFSGGVSSNSMLRNSIKNKYDACFAAPEFSCDNAAGTAIYAYLKYNGKQI